MIRNTRHPLHKSLSLHHYRVWVPNQICDTLYTIYITLLASCQQVISLLRSIPAKSTFNPTAVMADTKLPLHTVQRKPKLDSLPQEVYDLIFKHASSPRKRLKRYLWPLLFVSKRMYHAVLPALYRRISFNVHSSVGSYEANYKLLQLADKENQGLLHIQAIVLCPDDELERKPHDAADYPDVIQLLAAIPRNQLRKFR